MIARYEIEVEKLKKRLLELSGLVEFQFTKSMQSFLDRNSLVAQDAIDTDKIIDQNEVELEEKCLKILALHQPVATDLRFVVAALKINNDLERVGDLSVNIAQKALYLNEHPYYEIDFDFKHMSDITSGMLNNSLKALVNGDIELARHVIQQDDLVDELNRRMYKVVYDKVKSGSDQIEILINYLSISKHLERIADYTTNICEDVIYMIEGSIVRHDPNKYDPPQEA